MKLKVFILLLFSATAVRTAEIIPLPEVYLCPEIIRVDGPRLIFNYDLTFYVYKLDPFELKVKFGREGEGPGEFKNIIHLSIRPPHLLIYSMGKISFFSREGHLISELKLPEGRHLVPAGEGYVGYSMENFDRFIHVSVNLYGSRGEKLKRLIKKKHFFQINRPMDLIQLASGQVQRAHYQVYHDRIFIEGDSDTLHVFDFQGRELYIIPLNYPKRVIDQAQKQKIMNLLHSRFKSDRVRQLIKDNGFFPEHFPARRFIIDAGRIYIPTFRREGNKTQFVVFNIEGKFMKKIFLPFSELSLLIPYTYTIHDHKLYQFVENEDSENMEIHIHDIPD